jgi:hypothetical protein
VSTEETPPLSRVSSMRGVEGVCRQITPLSHNLSEGGLGGNASTEGVPLSHVLSKREGWRMSTEETPPSSRVSSK